MSADDPIQQFVDRLRSVEESQNRLFELLAGKPGSKRRGPFPEAHDVCGIIGDEFSSPARNGMWESAGGQAVLEIARSGSDQQKADAFMAIMHPVRLERAKRLAPAARSLEGALLVIDVEAAGRKPDA